jgi:RNA polymerase sigma factor (sigma-70 family)
VINSPATRSSLLVRIKDPADHAAWKQFVEIYLPLVYAYCSKRGMQEADAADISQEVMRAVAANMNRFEYNPKRGRFRGWLFSVTHNKLCTHVRSARRADQGSGRTTMQEILSQTPDAHDTEEWDNECRRRVYEWAAQQARQELHETTWEAFRLTAVEGRSAKDAAAATGLSVGAVYIAKSRVMARLREIVATASDDEAPIL